MQTPSSQKPKDVQCSEMYAKLIFPDFFYLSLDRIFILSFWDCQSGTANLRTIADNQLAKGIQSISVQDLGHVGGETSHEPEGLVGQFFA